MILWRLSNAKAFTKVPFFNQERKLGERRRLDTVVVPTVNNITSGYVTLIFYLALLCTVREIKGFRFRGEYSRKSET